MNKLDYNIPNDIKPYKSTGNFLIDFLIGLLFKITYREALWTILFSIIILKTVLFKRLDVQNFTTVVFLIFATFITLSIPIRLIIRLHIFERIYFGIFKVFKKGTCRYR